MAKDLFSNHASDYSKYRPGYPGEMIEYIVSFVEKKDNAWDCATGNGQAAYLISDHFKKVFATDISELQLAQARRRPNIEYRIAAAESTPFEENTFNLITVAQAYHWLDFEAFGKEANRVGMHNCIVAIFSYGLIEAEDKSINHMIKDFYINVTGPYWEFERKYVDDNYRSAPFYFNELPVSRSFSMKYNWTIEHLNGYLNTWSAIKKFIGINQYNPVENLINEIAKQWNGGSERAFEFKIFLRIGKINKEF